MIIEIGGTPHEVTAEVQDQLLNFFWQEALTKYQDLDPALRATLKIVARKILYDLEKKARRGGHEDAAKHMRPGKRQDPTLHLAMMMRHAIGEASNNATLTVALDTTKESKPCITNFSLSLKDKSTGGG